MESFKDNFSKHSDIYLKYRPVYPKALFEYLQSLTPGHILAWDCGTGNGQSAINLAEYYEQVYATDPSEKQIKNAIGNHKIIYKVEKAEQTALDDKSVDLVTVAQAIHWFDFDKFYAEVKRVLKDDGVIAVWAYGVPKVSDLINPIVRNFHDHVVGEFWQPENKLIEQEYTTIPFPFREVQVPEFKIQKELNLNELLGHFRSWSATQKFIEKYRKDPIEQLENELSKYWGKEEKEVTWKLILKAGMNI